MLHSDTAGIFRRMSYSQEIEPYIYRKCIYKHPGDNVEAFDGAGKAVGIVFLHFPDEETMNRLYPLSEKLIIPELL